MPKYKDSPEERAANELIKKQIQEVLTNLNVNGPSNLHELLRKMVGTILENALEFDNDTQTVAQSRRFVKGKINASRLSKPPALR